MRSLIRDEKKGVNFQKVGCRPLCFVFFTSVAVCRQVVRWMRQ
jgi:hypothetical protein